MRSKTSYRASRIPASSKAAEAFAKEMKGHVRLIGRDNGPLLKVANEVFAKSARRKVN
jgi:hypothetical protein